MSEKLNTKHATLNSQPALNEAVVDYNNSNQSNGKKRSFSSIEDNEDDIETKTAETEFLRHVIKQRSGNFPDLKRKYDTGHKHKSEIFDVISSNENTNRNKKLLQGSEWVSRSKMNTMLYENRVYYNGVEHKLLSRKKSKFNTNDNNESIQDYDEFDINELCHAEDVLKPISSLKDVVTHPNIKRTFLNNKVFNFLELQTALMIEKAKIESVVFNNYVSVFLGDDPLPYLEDKMKLPVYDHHIDFEHSDDNGKIYLDINDLLRENTKDMQTNFAEDNVGVSANTAEQNLKIDHNTKKNLFCENSIERENISNTNVEVTDFDKSSQIGENLKDKKTERVELLEKQQNTTDEDKQNNIADITNRNENDLQQTPLILDKAQFASVQPALEKTTNQDSDKIESSESYNEKCDSDEEDPFFALPTYSKSTLQQRLVELTGYDSVTNQQIDFSRQLTQILLQRNQEFIKNMIAIRMHLFKVERIRERIVQWGYEFSGITEEDVEIPNVLTAVKRGLISASTNRSSLSGAVADENQSGGEEEDED
ncbi:hypothetical protein QEN19_003769 [Hanseniaspora menglaensis]